MKNAINEVLEERGNRYGDFMGHAVITRNIVDAMANSLKWDDLAPDQEEALRMIAHKIGRILNGDPNYDDSWVDIAGYAQLVAQRLQKPKKERGPFGMVCDDVDENTENALEFTGVNPQLNPQTEPAIYPNKLNKSTFYVGVH